MGRPRGWGSEMTGRPVERSPGRPPAGRRENRVRFWEAIARGRGEPGCGNRGRGVGASLVSDGFGRVAACLLSLSPRCRGATCRSPSGRRSRCCVPRSSGCERSPARLVVHRRPSRGSCDATLRLAPAPLTYRASTAQWHADRRGRRPKPAKLAVNPELHRYVQDRLSGAVQRPDGSGCARPDRASGRAGVTADERTGDGARRGARSRSPVVLRLDFPDDESMRISPRGDLPSAICARPRRASSAS